MTGIQVTRGLFDTALMALLYIGGAVTLSVDWIYLLVISLSSIAGAAVLSYFKRDREIKEIIYKSSCAAVCGLVTGAAITRYLETQYTEYVAITYFLTSLLSLFFIGGLLAITERNATNIILGVLRKVLNTAQPEPIKLEDHTKEQLK